MIITLGLTASCVDQANQRTSDSEGIVNVKSSVNAGNGRLLQSNPIILSNNSSLPFNFNLALLLQSKQDFITNKTTLTHDCINVAECMEA